MKYCKNCGAEVTSKFCLQCGTPVGDAQEQESAPAVNDTAPVQSVPVQSSSVAPREKKKLGASGVFGIIGIAGIPAAEMVYLFFYVIGMIVAAVAESSAAYAGLVVTAEVLRMAVLVVGTVCSIIGLAIGLKKDDTTKYSKVVGIVAAALSSICMVWFAVSFMSSRIIYG